MIMDLAECKEHNIPSSAFFLKGRNLNQLLKIENRFIIKFSSSDTGGIHKCNTGKELRVGKSTASNPLQNSWLNCEKKISDLRICIFASSIK